MHNSFMYVTAANCPERSLVITLKSPLVRHPNLALINLNVIRGIAYGLLYSVCPYLDYR